MENLKFQGLKYHTFQLSYKSFKASCAVWHTQLTLIKSKGTKSILSFSVKTLTKYLLNLFCLAVILEPQTDHMRFCIFVGVISNENSINCFKLVS